MLARFMLGAGVLADCGTEDRSSVTVPNEVGLLLWAGLIHASDALQHSELLRRQKKQSLH